jgi:hypothetical protein
MLSFTTLNPGANVIKLFTPVVYELSYKARVFVIGKPFEPIVQCARLGVYP